MEKLELLNSLVHPRVAIDYSQWVVDHADHSYVIKEAALLFESGSYKALDKTILVTAPAALRIRRVLKRDNHRSKADVERIIQSQLPEAKQETMADYIIRNDETELLVLQILKLHKRFNTIN